MTSEHLIREVGARDHIMGTLDAPVILVEYGDYQCPYCGAAHPIVQEMQRRFGDSLAFVFRNFPLGNLHPDAHRAAETAEWAALANQFWPVHDYLFEHQQELAPTELLRAIRGFDLDPRALQMAWDGGALRRRVVEDMESGRASGVSGTPTFFINGRLYEDSWDDDSLALALRDAGAIERRSRPYSARSRASLSSSAGK